MRNGKVDIWPKCPHMRTPADKGYTYIYIYIYIYLYIYIYIIYISYICIICIYVYLYMYTYYSRPYRQPSELDQIDFSRFLICVGPRRNPAQMKAIAKCDLGAAGCHMSELPLHDSARDLLLMVEAQALTSLLASWASYDVYIICTYCSNNL